MMKLVNKKNDSTIKIDENLASKNCVTEEVKNLDSVNYNDNKNNNNYNDDYNDDKLISRSSSNSSRHSVKRKTELKIAENHKNKKIKELHKNNDIDDGLVAADPISIINDHMVDVNMEKNEATDSKFI